MRRTVLVLSLALALLSLGCRSKAPVNYEPRAVPSGSAAFRGPLLSYADMVDRVAPAVVTIRSTARVRAPRQFPFFDDPFFREFFGGMGPRGGAPQMQERSSLGSGVIVRADGYVLTNHHVIDGAQQIKVDLSSEKTYSATVVGSDPPSDLAVLKIDTSDLAVLQLGDSDQVRVGDVCLAIGNPLGVGETVTAGIISAKGRQTELSSGSYQDFLQTDAPINRGNSGGALVNTRGELIGINTAILSPSGEQGGNIGIGFAIPSNMAKNVMQQLIGKGQVRRGMLGVGIQNATTDIAASFGLKRAGIIVTSVAQGGPADKAGMKENDIIIKLNGKDVTETRDLRNQIAAMAPGTEVTLTVWRNNAEQQVKVRLGEMTQESASAAQRQGGGSGEPAGRLGLTVETITPGIARQLGVRAGTQGVVVTEVDPAGPAAEAGVQAGDIIMQVNRQPVRSPADVGKALQQSQRSTLLLLNRGGQNFYVSVQ